MKKIIYLIAVLIFCQNVYAGDVISYNYDLFGEYKPAPAPFKYETSILAEDLGVDSLADITDLYVASENLFISNGKSIIVADHNFTTQKIIDSVEINGEKQMLDGITGLFVTKAGELYACEPMKSRILHFNSDFTLNRVLERPTLVGLEDVNYQPQKIVVDSVGRMYVIAKNIYEGIIELNFDGTFSRYYGVNKIQFSPVELFWRSISTEEQRKRQKLWLPSDFSNLCVDSDGFIYATVLGEDEREPIRKLNAKGADILRFAKNNRPYGERIFSNTINSPGGNSQFIAIDVNDYGIYIGLDSKRNRIFAYNEDGYDLYNISGMGTGKGKLYIPIDLAFMGDKIIVADKQNASIEVFTMTPYGKAIHEASRFQSSFDYKSAAVEWAKVLEYNQNFEYANVGIGKANYRDGDYTTALDDFKDGMDRENYSKAFIKVRQDVVSKYFFPAIIAVIGIFILRFIYNRFKKAKA